MRLTVGQRVGGYEILALLGTGGIGEVYRARDTKLKRDVALKVLRDEFVNEADRLARFEREATILASLNHPNIAAIYGLAESSSSRALVMELVDGPTLGETLAGSGLKPQGRGKGLPIAEALVIARQIADALEAAHERGITHRDLKPANIKIRTDGTVKVLDFGLAKLAASRAIAGAAGEDSAATTMSPTGTAVGTILGTAAYMAPEQATGQEADRRSDLWAFGCIFYEMLTGRRLFEGKDFTETIGLVLTKEPDWSALPAGLPSAIRTLIQRCLERDRRKRIGDVAAIQFVLHETANLESQSVQVLPANERRAADRAAWPRLTAVGLVTLVALAAIAAAVVRGINQQAPAAADVDVLRFPVLPPEGWRIYVPDGMLNGPIAVSPDGRRVAFVGGNAQSGTRLWVQAFDSVTATPLSGTDGGWFPFWSPDSAWVGFFTGGELKKVSLAGGSPVLICPVPLSRAMETAAWNVDGTILFNYFGSALMRVSASGGSPVPATTLAADEASHLRPSFLPDGRHFIYTVLPRATTNNFKTFVGTLGAPADRVELPIGSAFVQYAAGRVLFLRGTTLVAQPFDDRRLQLSGDSVPVAENVRTQTQVGAFGVFSASDRALAYQGGSAGANSLVWLDASGHQLGVLGDQRIYTNLALGGDDARLVAGVLDPARRTRDIWTFDTARGVGTRVTSDPAEERSAVLSPDGRDVIFNSFRTGAMELYRKTIGSVGEGEPLLVDRRSKDVSDWSHDGRFVMYRTLGQGTGNDLSVLPLRGDAKPIPFLASPFNETDGHFSPDGRWVVYVSDDSGRGEVYIAAFPGANAKVRVSTDGGAHPRWRGDGKAVFYVAPDSMLRVVDLGGIGSAELTPGQPRNLFPINVPAGTFAPYVVTRDGQRFLVNTDAGAAMGITIVVNWVAALRK